MKLKLAVLAVVMGAVACGPVAVVDDSGVEPQPDASSPMDAGHVDAGLPDAGELDAGATDAGDDAGGFDAGELDAGGFDAGQNDAGPTTDAGGVDAGEVDAGQPDAGFDAGTPSAVLSLSGTDTDFGTVTLGSSSSTVTFVLSNSGNATSSQVTTSVGSTSFVLVDGCSGTTVAAGATCSVTVHFQPLASGTASTTLTVTTVSGDHFTRALTGLGVTPGSLTISPTGFDFGAVALGATSAPHTFTITNSGGSVAGQPSLAFTGTVAAWAQTSTTCTGPLAAGANCTATVQFQPGTVGAKPASLSASAAPGGTAVAMLSGVGTASVTVTAAGNGSGQVTSSPPGLNCGATCAFDFSSGPVTLTATPAVGSTFAGFSGDCVGSSCTLALATAQQVTATFTLQTPTLTVARTGAGTGTVTSTSGAINCGATCSASVLFGTVVTLTASPAPGSLFTGWSGGACQGTNPTCTVTATQSQTVTATFGPSTYTLSVVTSGFGVGTVSGGPISCGATCSAAVNAGASVTLTATPSGTDSFSGWSGADSGACAGTTAPCTVLMNQARTVTATFAPGSRRLSVVPTPFNAGLITSLSGSPISCGGSNTGCSAAEVFGSQVTLVATPATGWQFDSWVGGTGGTGATCGVSMFADTVVEAYFSPQVLASVTGPGTITSSPAGLTCGPTCTATFPRGSMATLTATPSNGATFMGWTGDCASAGTATTCTLLMGSPHPVGAAFGYALDVTVVGGTQVTSTAGGAMSTCSSGTCTQVYDPATMVTLTATQPAHFSLAWSGCTQVVGTTCKVTMNQAHAVTATLTAITFPLTVSLAGTGGGTVTSAPTGISCSNAASGGCQADVPWGTDGLVTLTATPDAHTIFEGWTGACTNAAGTCVVTMDQARSVTATFTRVWTLTVVPDSTGTGVILNTTSSGGTLAPGSTPISCDGSNNMACVTTYVSGSTVTLTAPKVNFFSCKGSVTFSANCAPGPLAAGSTSCTITPAQDETVTLTIVGQLVGC